MTNQTPRKTVHVLMRHKTTKKEMTVSVVAPEEEQMSTFRFASEIAKTIKQLGGYRAIGFWIEEEREVE